MKFAGASTINCISSQACCPLFVSKPDAPLFAFYTVFLTHPVTKGSGDFSNPESFRAGAPIQNSVLRQPVVVYTVSQTFTAINQDTNTSTSGFSVNGSEYQIGRVGDVFRTTKNGYPNPPGASPTGWFAGYSVGAGKSQQVDRLRAKAEQ